MYDYLIIKFYFLDHWEERDREHIDAREARLNDVFEAIANQFLALGITNQRDRTNMLNSLISFYGLSVRDAAEVRRRIATRFN